MSKEKSATIEESNVFSSCNVFFPLRFRLKIISLHWYTFCIHSCRAKSQKLLAPILTTGKEENKRRSKWIFVLFPYLTQVEVRLKLEFALPKSPEEVDQTPRDYDWQWTPGNDGSKKNDLTLSSDEAKNEKTVQQWGSLDLMPPLVAEVDADEYSVFLQSMKKIGDEKERGHLTEKGFLEKRGRALKEFVTTWVHGL